MDIQILKTKLVPQQIFIQNRILFLITVTTIHIIDLKGNLIPDINLKNVKILVKTTSGDFIESKKKINLQIKDAHIFKSSLIILSTTQNVYFCQIGENNIHQIDIRADKISSDSKLLILQNDTIFEVKIKNNRTKILPIIFHIAKINNFIEVDRKILFQSDKSIFVTRYSNRFDVKIDDNISYFDSKKGLVSKTLHAFENIEFLSMKGNNMFFLLESIKDLVVFSAHSNTIVIKKPDVFYSAELVGSYVFIFSDKILIFSVITGQKMKELPITIFKGAYDPESGLLLLQNETIFITDAIKIVNRFLFANSKKLETNESKYPGGVRNNPGEWFKSFLVKRKIYQPKNPNINLITVTTPHLNLIDYKTAIENKLYIIAEKINQRETFFRCSLEAFQSNKISRGLFFYARSRRKYSFNRTRCLELCKNLQVHEKLQFDTDYSKHIEITIKELIYFLSIRAVYMKREIDFLFYISLTLKLVKYIKYIIKYVIESNLRLKILERLSFDLPRNIDGAQDIKIPSHISISCPSSIAKKQFTRTNWSEFRADKIQFLSQKKLKRLIVRYWAVRKPEKAIIFFFEDGNFGKCNDILLKKFHEIKNIKDLLLKIKLYETVTSSALIKLYHIYVPNLLTLLAKANAVDNIAIFITEAVDILRESQHIYKTIAKMDQKSKEIVKQALNQIDNTENIELLRRTINILCENVKSKHRSFKCDGKIIN